ncbi:hypothetical protein TCAL_05495 [Tigriopus californicus]|uniref:Uncharacterized protein n=1 Tax=Tigriopus californicus TaxID=6832 RepID=A0A553NPK2_TIGCA|nr:uncharacterized protein LOC131879331 [Tigriopus californicus]TRY67368.1 hypothetical protein TCAL_05495 [Tigriopus californicus]|eukprot:TCALIF_05495-PA protein Name:"Protein of unknown function" AED:0.02 eAED:0.02 QI:46/1/0/1/1/0.5/2/0/200
MNTFRFTVFIFINFVCCLAWPFNLRLGGSSYGPGPKGNPLLVDTSSHHTPNYFGRSSENVAKVNIKIGSHDLQDLPEIRPATNVFDQSEQRFDMEDWIRRSIGEYFSFNNRTPDLKAPPIRGLIRSHRNHQPKSQPDVQIHINNRNLDEESHSIWDRIFETRENRPRKNWNDPIQQEIDLSDLKETGLPIIRPATNTRTQ